MFHKIITLAECETIIVSSATGSISFSSTPPEADIYLIASGGGPPVNMALQTPNIISDLPVGNYDYILKLQGFEDYIGTVTVDANMITPVAANLVPIPISPTSSPTIPPAIVVISGLSILGLLLVSTPKRLVKIQ